MNDANQTAPLPGPLHPSPAQFRLVFTWVVVVTILSMVGCFFTTYSLGEKKHAATLSKEEPLQADHDYEDLKRFGEALQYVFTLGCGTIVGLIGGKGLQG